MKDQEERLLKDLESAASAVRRGAGGKAGESSEKVYGIAYQKCVQGGIKPKLRKKYR
jgi:hypothetical protein